MYEPPANSKQVLSRRSTRRTNPLLNTPDATLFSTESDNRTQKSHKARRTSLDGLPEDIPNVIETPSFEDVYAALDSIHIPINESRKNVSAHTARPLCAQLFHRSRAYPALGRSS